MQIVKKRGLVDEGTCVSVWQYGYANLAEAPDLLRASAIISYRASIFDRKKRYPTTSGSLRTTRRGGKSGGAAFSESENPQANFANSLRDATNPPFSFVFSRPARPLTMELGLLRSIGPLRSESPAYHKRKKTLIGIPSRSMGCCAVFALIVNPKPKRRTSHWSSFNHSARSWPRNFSESSRCGILRLVS